MCGSSPKEHRAYVRFCNADTVVVLTSGFSTRMHSGQVMLPRAPCARKLWPAGEGGESVPQQAHASVEGARVAPCEAFFFSFGWTVVRTIGGWATILPYAG